MFVFRRIFALLPASSDTKTFSEDREKDFLKHKACPAIFCQAKKTITQPFDVLMNAGTFTILYVGTHWQDV